MPSPQPTAHNPQPTAHDPQPTTYTTTRNLEPQSEDELMEVLLGDEKMMKKLCLIYAQDFICFGYDLPSACDGLF